MRSLAVITFLCASAALAADKNDTASSRLTAHLKEEFHFDPAANPKQGGSGEEPVEDVVILPPFNVVGVRRGLEDAVAEAAQRAEEEHFTWKHGGTILKLGNRVEIKFKYNPDHNGIDLLNFSW